MLGVLCRPPNNRIICEALVPADHPIEGYWASLSLTVGVGFLDYPKACGPLK